MRDKKKSLTLISGCLAMGSLLSGILYGTVYNGPTLFTVEWYRSSWAPEDYETEVTRWRLFGFIPYENRDYKLKKSAAERIQREETNTINTCGPW